MLGSVPESNQKPLTTGQATDSPERGTIERAVSKEGQRSGFSPEQKQTAASAREDKLPGSGDRVSRTLHIDWDKMRQQNMITLDDKRTAISENFRRIKRHILANLASPNAGLGSNLVMITSALPGEGKTFCTINLAISIAMEMDRTVLLVDADVAKPSITSALGIKAEAEMGLMDVLSDRGIDLASVLFKTDMPSLSILPAGTRHARATEVLASERMRILLQEMAQRYSDRVIIFDSPPLLVASEASVLANRMGQILVVVEAGKTQEAALKKALGRIESGNVLGVLLNKGEAPESEYGYDGYGYD
jgi:exopolysaccharide/PEP-CTERM locus tyrosine autokinase